MQHQLHGDYTNVETFIVCELGKGLKYTQHKQYKRKTYIYVNTN